MIFLLMGLVVAFDGVQLIPVSGITGDGLDDLIEGLALQSEVMDLRVIDFKVTLSYRP